MLQQENKTKGKKENDDSNVPLRSIFSEKTPVLHDFLVFFLISMYY